jgi:small nuclear ribonucleoprotein (snRNP)-like protein
VTGTLKGYDQLMNLVMDDVVEEFEGMFYVYMPALEHRSGN